MEYAKKDILLIKLGIQFICSDPFKNSRPWLENSTQIELAENQNHKANERKIFADGFPRKRNQITRHVPWHKDQDKLAASCHVNGQIVGMRLWLNKYAALDAAAATTSKYHVYVTRYIQEE